MAEVENGNVAGVGPHSRAIVTGISLLQEVGHAKHGEIERETASATQSGTTAATGERLIGAGKETFDHGNTTAGIAIDHPADRAQIMRARLWLLQQRRTVLLSVTILEALPSDHLKLIRTRVEDRLRS